MIRALVGTFALTACAGLLMRLTLRDVPTTEEAIDMTAALGAALFGCVLMFTSSWRDRRLRGLHIALVRLGDKDVGDAALIRVVRLLTETRGRPEHARLTLYAASHLMQNDRHDVAKTHLAALDPAKLDAETAAVRGQTLATCLLQQGALEEADEALSAIARPASDALEPWLLVTEAWIRVIAGGADDALRLVSEDSGGAASTSGTAPDVGPQLRNVRRAIRAHAHACRGEQERAESLLRKATDELGTVGLAPALRPVGPATDIARALLAELASATMHAPAGAMKGGDSPPSPDD